MKALTIFEKEKAGFVDVPEPPAPKKGEAKLKIKALGLCGSDLAAYLGKSPLFVYPSVLGHEFSAEVVEVNDPEGRIKVGDHVTCAPLHPCGECIACRRGSYNCCVELKVMGVHVGGAAQAYYNVPLKNVFPVPKDLSWQEAALTEPMTIGYHAVVNRGKVTADDFVCIIGSGPIGLGAMQAAKVHGAKVAVVDIKDNSLERAKKLGADYTINSLNENVDEKIAEYSGGDMATMVVEAVGMSELIIKAVDLMAASGRIVLIGWAKNATGIDTTALMKKEGSIHGSRNSRDVFPDVIEHIVAGRINVKELISQEYSADDGQKALEFWKDHADEVVKIVLNFD
jgi:L-gulonate 5-dehydrogenase